MLLEREVIADHQISFVNLKFVFDGDWKKFHKVVQFSQCDEIYSIVLGFDGTSCYLPSELHVGAERLEYEVLAIRESMIPLTRELHSHKNMAVLDILTAEQLAMLGGLQQFEDSTKYDIQTIRESVEPVVSQAHWHHNLTLLNSITSAKVAKWDSISQLESDLQQLCDSVQYDQQNQNDAIQMLENRITILESQIANGSNAVTLFSAGSDVFEWLYSANFITTLISCSDIPAGEYYLAWTGVSDNTHPKIKSIKIMGG